MSPPSRRHPQKVLKKEKERSDGLQNDTPTKGSGNILVYSSAIT